MKLIFALFIIMILLTLSCYFIFSYKKNRQSIDILLEVANQIPIQTSEYILKSVGNKEDLREILELDCEFYQDISMEFEKYFALWSIYPEGINILRRQNNIVGVFSIWPVKEKIFKKLVEGIITEEQVSLSDIMKIKNHGHCSTWYISSVQVIEAYRKSHVIYHLASMSIKKWFASGKAVLPLRICSMAYSDAGEKLSIKRGFVKIKDSSISKSKMSTYQLVLNTKEDVEKFVNSFTPSSIRNKKSL